MRKTIIVAKFTESVAWIETLGSAWEPVIYSKNPKETDVRFIKLPNIGRESHTYLTFIIDNYHHLPDLCVFTQGNPFEHAPNFIDQINRLELPCAYRPFSKVMALFDCFGLPHLAASPVALDQSTFRDFFEKILGQQPPPLMYCAMNGLFAVDRDMILRHPHSFYKSCLELLVGKNEAEFNRRVGLNLVEGHFFERLWPFIFGNFSQEEWSGSAVHGLPPERLIPIAALLEKWPGELARVGPVKASAILLAANELLES